jgi:hypothetical protein
LISIAQEERADEDGVDANDGIVLTFDDVKRLPPSDHVAVMGVDLYQKLRVSSQNLIFSSFKVVHLTQSK